MILTLPAPDYHTHYLAMANAMLAEDPEIKVGPCINKRGRDQRQRWLNAILTDPACRVDFVAYHPYGPLYWYIKNVSGGSSTAQPWRPVSTTSGSSSRIDIRR